MYHTAVLEQEDFGTEDDVFLQNSMPLRKESTWVAETALQKVARLEKELEDLRRLAAKANIVSVRSPSTHTRWAESIITKTNRLFIGYFDLKICNSSNYKQIHFQGVLPDISAEYYPLVGSSSALPGLLNSMIGYLPVNEIEIYNDNSIRHFDSINICLHITEMNQFQGVFAVAHVQVQSP